MDMALWTPSFHCPLVSRGTTLTCRTLGGIDSSPRIRHSDLQVLPQHPWQHWVGHLHPPIRTLNNIPTCQGSLFPSSSQAPPCSWWALQHCSRLRFSMRRSPSPIILYAILLLPGLWPALGQRRPWPKKLSGHVELSCHNWEPGHLWNVCSLSLAVANYIEKKISISSNWNSSFIYFLSSKLWVFRVCIQDLLISICKKPPPFHSKL